MLLTLFILYGICAQVLKDDPFYGKTMNDFPDYFERERRAQPGIMQLRLLDTTSKVGTIDEAKRLFNLAGMTYCRNETTGNFGSKYIKGLGNKIKIKFVMEDPNLVMRGLIAVDKSRSQFLLAFRGTTSYRNWITNLNFNKVPFGPGTAHAGFKRLADAMLPKYREYLMDLLTKFPAYRLVIVGHSLGGAVAVLSAIHLSEYIPWRHMSIYTYGQPRIGDEKLVRWLNSKPMHMTRVVNGADTVPHLPPNFAGFFHAHTEIFVQPNNVTICSTSSLEDPSCSRTRVIIPNPALHSVAFNMTLDDESCSPLNMTNNPFNPTKQLISPENNNSTQDNVKHKGISSHEKGNSTQGNLSPRKPKYLTSYEKDSSTQDNAKSKKLNALSSSEKDNPKPPQPPVSTPSSRKPAPSRNKHKPTKTNKAKGHSPARKK